jgi:hypothetical protein
MCNLTKHRNFYISMFIEKEHILKMTQTLIYGIISNELFDIHRKYKLIP